MRIKYIRSVIGYVRKMNSSYLNHTWAAWVAIQVYNHFDLYMSHSGFHMYHVNNLRKNPHS